MKKLPRIALIGATGMVGSVLLEILEKSDFPIAELFLLASGRSAGELLVFQNRTLRVTNISEFDFSRTDLCFFAAGEKISAAYAEIAAAAGNVVIDKSAYFRMNQNVPLVIPEVNPEAIFERPKNIIASPNCSTIPIAMVLKPLQDAAGIARVNIATYQSVSGSGKEGITELADQTSQLLNCQPVVPKVYSAQIAFNVLPQIDVLEENGFTREEMKLMLEIGKILNDERIGVNATAVRVPIFYGHSAAVHVETRVKLSPEQALSCLEHAPGIRLVLTPNFPTPLQDGVNFDEVTVGRVRKDPSHPRGLNFWVVGDNVRKGAALNAVQIAQKIFWQEKNLRG